MGSVVILDGGMGRELQRIGAPFSQPLWSAQALIESPQHVTQAHQSFIDAGADVITTNSYACVPFHLGEKRFKEQGFELAQLAAKLARDVADKANHTVKVAGSLPPALGSYRADLFDATRALEIISVLYDAQKDNVDYWLVETISCIAELNTISLLLAQSDKPCFYSFTLSDDISDEPRLRSGESVSDAIALLNQTNATGVLFNCSIPEVMEKAIAQAAEFSNQGMQIGAYANAFTPIGAQHQANGGLTSMREIAPLEYVEFARSWQKAGATMIGGCCGIGPEYIRSLADLNRFQ